MCGDDRGRRVGGTDTRCCYNGGRKEGLEMREEKGRDDDGRRG